METKEPENVIFTYTDAQALDDGVLVAIRRGPVNRVTRAVFDHFTAAMGDSPVTGLVTDVTRLMRAIEAMLKLEPDGDGWRTGAYEGKTLWLVPNEVEGLTLDVSRRLLNLKSLRPLEPSGFSLLPYFRSLQDNSPSGSEPSASSVPDERRRNTDSTPKEDHPWQLFRLNTEWEIQCLLQISAFDRRTIPYF